MSIKYTELMEEIAEIALRGQNRDPETEEINWNYVDADCWMEGIVKKFKDSVEFYTAFNNVADDMEGRS
jgi:hypothetical protein